MEIGQTYMVGAYSYICMEEIHEGFILRNVLTGERFLGRKYFGTLEALPAYAVYL